MTNHEKLVVSAYTGILMTDFADLHAYIEETLGRKVHPGEIGLEILHEELREKLATEFSQLCFKEEPNEGEL